MRLRGKNVIVQARDKTGKCTSALTIKTPFYLGFLAIK